MGTRNANCGGGLDRSKVAQMSETCTLIPQAVSPEGLRARAEIMRETGNESCARHLELAADEIQRLRKTTGQKPSNSLDDPELQAHAYNVGTNMESGEACVMLYRDSRQTQLLAYLILTTPEVYDLFKTMERTYDKLEGIA